MRYKIITSILVLSIITPSLVFAGDNYVYRYHLPGVKALNNDNDNNGGNTNDDEKKPDNVSVWNKYADENNLPYGDWVNGIYWSNRSIYSLPTEPYPASGVNGGINLIGNEISNISGLGSIESIGGYFDLGNNNIMDLSPLINLRDVGGHLSFYNNDLRSLYGLDNLVKVGEYFYLERNNLENLDGLGNLTTINGDFTVAQNNIKNVNGISNLELVNGGLYFNDNNISDLYGLRNTVVEGAIRIDSDYSGLKLPLDSTFCINSNSEQFQDGFAKKGQICLKNSDEAWSEFLSDNNLETLGSDWDSGLSWRGRGISKLPEESYPASNIKGDFYLGHNNIGDISGLSSLETVGGHLDFFRNSLKNVDALSNLTKVGSFFSIAQNNLNNINGLINLVSVGDFFDIYGNNLTNLDSLINLRTVAGDFRIYENPLNNLNGIRNINVGGKIFIDERYSGPKLPYNTRFCQLNDASKFPPDRAQKDQVCN